jgi:hypothetical protein
MDPDFTDLAIFSNDFCALVIFSNRGLYFQLFWIPLNLLGVQGLVWSDEQGRNDYHSTSLN